MARASVSKAPTGLGPAGRAYFEKLSAEVEVSVERERLLRDCAMVVDTIETLTAAMVGEPLTMRGSAGGTIAHPLLSEIRMQRALLAKLTQALMIPEEVGADGKMTREQSARKAALTRWGKLA